MTAAMTAAPTPSTLPAFDGFHMIERLGAGGMGEVYKLRDLKLERTATTETGSTMIDLTAVICPYVLCPAVLDGMITYRDAIKEAMIEEMRRESRVIFWKSHAGALP